MNLHTLFDLHTMEHRHLVIAYAAVWLIQGSYGGWILRNWLRDRRTDLS